MQIEMDGFYYVKHQYTLTKIAWSCFIDAFARKPESLSDHRQ